MKLLPRAGLVLAAAIGLPALAEPPRQPAGLGENCSASTTPLATAGNPTAPAARTLVQSLAALAQREEIPAFAVALVIDGQQLAHAQGRSGRADVTIDASTPFRVGSISKTFTALLAGLTAANGWHAAGQPLLDLDAALTRYGAAPLDNPWPTPVTAAQLLEHSAGFGDLGRAEWDSNVDLTLAQGLALDPSSRVSRWPPGLFHSYSNAGAGVVAWQLQSVTGGSWEDLLRAHVLVPLGMQDASARLDAATQNRLPLGFAPDGQTVIPWWRMHIGAYAAVNASARDMLIFLDFLQRCGHGRPTLPAGPSVIERMQTPSTSLAARHGLQFGYGLGLYTRSVDGHLVWGHGGDADGFRSRFGYLASHRRAWFVAINLDAPAKLGRLVAHLESRLLADLPVPATPAAAPVDLTRYVGRYREVTRRFGALATAATAEVRAAAGQLTLLHDGARTVLIAVDQQRFRRPGDTLATHVFVRDNGRLLLVGETGNFVREERASDAASAD